MIMYSAVKEVPATIPLGVSVPGRAGRTLYVCRSVDYISLYFQYFKRINK